MNKESIDLLEEICENDYFHSSIFLTYGADLGFYEQAILYKLRQNNCLNNIIFMDAVRYNETISNFRDTVEWVGRRYTITSIKLNPFQSFHPKLFLLVGYEKCRLFIGSGNLTFTGIGKNQEVFTSIDYEYKKTKNAYLFKQVWGFIDEITQKYPTPKQVIRTLRKIESSSPFQKDNDEQDDGSYFFHSIRTPLIDQVVSMVNGEKVKEILIFSPFIDKNANAIKVFKRKFSPKAIKLVVQNNQVVGNPKSLSKLQKDGLPLRVFELNDTDNSYLHAKIYKIQTNKYEYIITGSANCTDSAWLKSAVNGNVETVICRRTPGKGYFDYLFKHMNISEKSIDPSHLVWKDNTEIKVKSKEPVSLYDAEYDGLNLHLIFELSKSLEDNLIQVVVENEILELSDDIKLIQGVRQDITIPATELLITRSTPVFLRIIDRESNQFEGVSSKIWINLTSELNDPRQKIPVNLIKASELLASRLVESDDKWRELFDAIRYIVDLGINEIQKNPTRIYKTSPANDKRKSNDKGSKETKVVFWNPEDEQSQEEFIDLIQIEWIDSIIELVRSQLSIFTEQGKTERGGKKKPIPQRKEVHQKQKPNPSLELKFLNLIKRYIKQLFNETYMKNVGFDNIPVFFYIFSRILWILKNHQGIQPDNFYSLLRDINTGIFGIFSENNPALEPRLSRHINRFFLPYWQKQSYVVYALSNAVILREYTSTIDDQQAKQEINSESIRLIASCSIISSIGLASEYMETFDDIAELIQMPKEQVMKSYDHFLLDNSIFAYGLLEKWEYELTLLIKNQKDESGKMLLIQRIEDYNLARYNLSTLIQESVLQIQACFDVIFSAQKLAHKELEIEYREKLKPLLERAGQIGDLARNYYETARLEEKEGNKQQANSLYNLAEGLATESSNESLAKLCGIHKDLLYKG